MAQHGAAGWAHGPVGPGMDGNNPNGHDSGFVGHVDHNTGSYLEGPANHEQPYEHISYTPNTNPYGQQGHGHYANQQQYSNIGFAVEGQPAFSRNGGSLGPAQVVGQPHANDYQQPNVQYGNNQNLNYQQYHGPEIVGHYPDFAQPQQHVGLNDFQQNSWAEPQSQHGSSNPYAQRQQFYGSNPALLRMATASPAQSSTPKSDQSQSSYQDPASLYQPQSYGGTYPTPQSTEIRHGYPTQVPHPAALASGRSSVTPTPSPGPTAAPHPVAWSSQAPAQRLGGAPIASASARTPPSVPRPPMNDLSRVGSKLSVPMTGITSNEPMIVVPRAGRPEGEWNSVKGCPNLFVGAKPVKRKIVTNTPGVKPHVAGDNRNGTPLLPLLPDSLPCEKLREIVRPIVDELKEVSESIDKSKEQIKNTSSGSEEHKRYTDDLKKAESKKASLESEKKRITGKAGVLKVGKGRAAGKSDSADYDSESLTESSEEEDPQELIVQQIMASENRPTDPDKGVQYDVVRIIRNESGAEQGAASQGEREDAWSKVIGRRVADFGKYVVDMCAEAKALREQRSTAPKSQSSQLQAAIDQKYDLVRLSLETALEFGDEETLRNMGQHMKLMSGLTIVLSRQFAIKSYNTAVPRTILRFISAATLMDLDVFNKVKLSSVLEKHRDSLDDEGKQLVAQISKNAEERTAKNAAEKPTVLTQPRPKSLDNAKESGAVSTQKTTTPVAKGLSTATKVQAPQSTNLAQPETARKETKNYSGLLSARKVANHGEKATPRASPIKRQRDDETDSRAAKKIVVESNTGGTGAGRAVSAPISNSVAPLNSTSQNGQTRPRPSGSTVLNKSRAASKPPTKRPEPQSSVSSTISGLLAEIAKPAEKPKVQERTVKVSETPEEKIRRLRKESRRGRTVMWKPDDELVQIRFFEHDSTEDEGRAGNMIRDARDNRLEGQMLKQMQRNMQEGDDEDDDGNPAETDLRPWATPQSFDYSLLDNGQKGKNYVTRGGTRDIHSEQKKVMEEYENRELMSIYTTLSEIPETPRSPKKTSEPVVQPKQALLLPDNPQGREIHQRWSEARQFGTITAAQAAMQRLGISPHYGGSSASASLNARPNIASSQPTTAARMMTQEERDVQVLALLQSDRARNYVDPDPYDPANPRIIEPPKTNDETVQKAWSNLQSIVEEYKRKNPQSTAPSQGPQSASTHPYESYAGYGQDPAQVKREEEYARQATNSTQSQYGASQTSHLAAYQAQAQQQPQTYSQLGPQVPDQYAAILQQVQALQNPQASQNTAIPQPAPAQTDNTVANLLATLKQTSQPAQTVAQDANYAAWQAWAQSQAQSYGAQLQNQSYPSYSQQQYDGASREDGTYGSQKRDYTQYQQQESSERGNRKDFHRGANKDHKGINRALIGTKPCTFWAKGQCAKGDSCTFRHDPNDLK
ncbi:hypothetical protein GGR51DRAFT_550290 [Nemania sp. FL0031]|nr:hypothetical protein GGR51DRAFT_550290 [Nemania sp. FL0031]